ncbi:ATG9A protein, partial [Hemiprocne comata]|nr:ATG9A protein [Hemiprocne comata]
IYRFHQRNGFACILLGDLCELGQFLFVVALSTFLLCCLDYDTLFANRPLSPSPAGAPGPDHPKVTLPDAVLPPAQCAQRIQAQGWLLFLLAVAGAFWLWRLGKVLCDLLGYWEIRRFYTTALHIPSAELCSYSWQEVQARLLRRQHQLCVQRRELSELDVHHRILRRHNYAVAMVSQELLPLRLRLPLLGPIVFLTRGLQYNLELLLFHGPASLFQSPWSLHPQCKRVGARHLLARRL